MTLSAPTHLNGRRRAAATHHRPAEPAESQEVLMVDLVSPDGRTWWAVGVGYTVAEALAFAEDSCPADTTWQPISWNDLYGD